MRFFILQTLLAVCVVSVVLDIKNYNSERSRLLQEESLLTLGGKTTLNDKENMVNNCLMRHKFRELDYGFNNPQYFNLSHHYFLYKDKMRESKVYNILKSMPKGALLHVHDKAIMNADYIMSVTYMQHLYVCFENNKVQLVFSNATPTASCNSQWQDMSHARNSSRDIKKFDADLRRHFTMVVENPDVYADIQDTWAVFSNYFYSIYKLFTYRPVWEQYIFNVLKKIREDNLMYVELRTALPNLYELNGVEHDQFMTAAVYRKVIRRFVKLYPDFVGAKLIYAPGRKFTWGPIEEHIRIAKKVKTDFPDIFAGLDLVGQEDLGDPLIKYVPQLTAAAGDLSYFFHAGETDWFGTTTDENLVDAILLGAKRIGHAYALPKHPVLMDEVLKKDIGLEVNVISNTVLSLVHDVRNHPLSTFLARGLPVVITSDDPGAWEAEPLSDDLYVAFVGAASRHSDLRLLKQLALNSLKYSAMGDTNKMDAIQKFQRKWTDFVNNFNCSVY